jgi:hypothetical protein
MQAMKGIKREGASYCAEETVVGVVNARKKKLRWPDVRARVSARERGGRVPFRAETVLGRGRFSGWAEMAPLSPFSIFFVLSSFLFLFSYFLYNFCINSSNNVKPISNLF